MGPKWALLPVPSPDKCREPLGLFSRRPFQFFQNALVAVAIFTLGNLALALPRISMQTKYLRRIAMNFTRKTIHVLTRSMPRLLPRVALIAGIALVPAAALAQSPWVTAIQNLANNVSGPIARGLSLVAIVIGGLMWSFSEGGDNKRMLGGIIFGVAMAIGAVNFMQWLFP